ncbi:hypothetical protein BDN72DRAFT_805774 [Pluteus cervinus]|uniref:Uncharacterized protein n=1 Tax=Pluteus cervinus TaxID=181527 RepID=A0ACD3A363_9AGAR|nr:hypothetical protein BDN72DRAFT_805774 [Pluteus cervinus]
MVIGDRDELRTKIDEEVAALSEHIRCLHTTRNTLAPVSSLPPEVLSRIFLLVRDSSANHGPSSRKYLEWLSITQICQLWRQIAIGCAALWTKIPPRNEKCLQLFLTRSRTCPLSLSIDITEYNLPFARLAMQSLPRIQGVHLHCFRSGNWNKIVPFLCYPAPELKELSVSCSDRDRPGVLSWPQDFLRDAPLRELTLSGFLFPDYQPAFHGLTLFCLTTIPCRTPTAILLGALAQMPNLRSLTVEDPNTSRVGTGDDREISDDLSKSLPIILPHLEDITIHSPGEFEHVLQLFNALQFPKSPTLKIQCGFDEWEDISDSFPQLCQTLQETYQNGMTPFYTLTIGADATGFKLIACDAQMHFSCVLDIHCRDESLDDYLDHWVDACLDLPVTGLESVDLYGSGCPKFFSTGRYRRWTQLRHVKVEDERGFDFIEVLLTDLERHCKLRTDLGDEDEVAYAETCCDGKSWNDSALPALEVITLHRSGYGDFYHNYCIQALIARKRHGYGPKKIIFSKCSGVTAKKVKDLQNIIEVEWDSYQDS